MKIINLMLGNKSDHQAIEAITYYADVLNQIGAKVLCIVHSESSAIEELVKLPVKLKTLTPKIFLDFSSKKRLIDLIDDFSPDLLITYDEYSHEKVKGLNELPVAFFLGRKIKKPISCDAVIYNNLENWRTYGECIKLKIPGRNYFLPIEYMTLHNNQKKNHPRENFITFGTELSADFDHDINLIFKTFSLMNDSCKNFKLVISDRTKNEEIGNLIRNYRLEDFVQILPQEIKFADFLDLIDIYVSCPYENINPAEINILLNKQIPLILPIDDKCSRSIIHGINGYLYNKSDMNELSNLLEKITKYESYISEIIAQKERAKNQVRTRKYLYSILEELTINSLEIA